MSRRQRNTPSAEDIQLWETVANSVSPLKRRAKRVAPVAEPKVTAQPAPPAPAKTAKAEPQPRPAKAQRAPSPAPATLFDRRTRAKITKGKVSIDARVDLHGLTQAAAHQRLRYFLEDARASGIKMALVITGKGLPDAERLGEARGVLRRVVPGWLGSAEFRTFVVGFEPAGRRHGGDGALYVRLRSRKPG